MLNRVTAAYDGLNATDAVATSYDALLPVAVRDPSGNVDSTEYDALGRVTRHFGYASATVATTVRYDRAGRPTSTTNRRGQRIDVTYDPLGRVLSKSGDNTTTDSLTYSANGLVATASNATESVRMVSVPSARLDTVETTILASGVTQHTYTVVHHQSSDAGGTDSTTISSDGAPAQLVTRRYVNDATNGTLKAIDLGGSIGAGTFTSDVGGWRTGTAWPAASRTSTFLTTGTHDYETYGSSLDPSFYVRYRVDSAGRILRDHRHDGSTTTYTNRIFGYDQLGRYTGTTTVSESQYPWNCGGSGSFDPNYGEVGCAIDSVPTPYVYSYDGDGNRVGAGISNGVGDRVTTSDGMSYTYDADGNVATRTQTATGTVWTYSWSSENRLLSANKSNGTGGATSVSFDYDALGQPVVKRGSKGEVTRVTLYDGGSILADLDAAGNRIAEYVYDEGTDRPYVMLTGSTTVTGARYYAQDDMGNVEGQFSDASHVTETVTYGDWGLPSMTGETVNRLTWKGLSYDPDVGLTYVRARWYDPNIGRFVSEDPLGLQAGINPYVFANNDPIDGSDPSGEKAYIFTDNNDCQYSYVIGGPDVTFQIGGCDFGSGGNDPFANDPAWGHSDGTGSSGGAIGSTGGGGGQTRTGQDLTPISAGRRSGAATARPADVGEQAVQKCRADILYVTASLELDVVGFGPFFTEAKAVVLAERAFLSNGTPEVAAANSATLRAALRSFGASRAQDALVGSPIALGSQMLNRDFSIVDYLPIPGLATLRSVNTAYQACFHP